MSDELPPVRCVTCNKILGNLFNDYQKKLEQGTSIEDALNEVGLRRYCCRLRLRNPFKIVDRNVQSESDIDKMFESNFETLSISRETETNTTGALSAISDETSMLVIPEDDEEDEYDLPPIISISASNDMPFRTYHAE